MGRFLSVVFTTALMLAPAAALADDPALSDAANQAYLAQNAHKPGTIVRPDGLQYTVIQPGAGNHPAATDQVDVVYVGALINGHVFDRSDPGSPRTFRVYQLIPGWTEALTLMRPGAEWQIVIPADLAYGAKGMPAAAIPPNQSLVFVMKLVAFRRARE